MDNLEEMDRFLEKLKLQKLNQEEMEITNKPITSTEIETVIKKKKIPPKQKPKARWLHRYNLSNIERRANAYSSETLSEYCLFFYLYILLYLVLRRLACLFGRLGSSVF